MCVTVFIACTLSLASLWCADTTRCSRRRTFLLLKNGEQVRLPTVSGSVETEACVSGSRSPLICGVNHKTVITATLWPFLLRVGAPFFFFLNGQFSWEKPLRSDYLGHHNLKRKAQNACTMFPNISLTSKLNYESQKLFCCVTILRKAAPEYLLVMFRTFQIQLPLNRALTMSLCLL